MKKLFWALGFIFLVSTGLLIAPGLVDWNQYKEKIQDQFRDATGRDVNIHGDISITILPAPALIVNDVSLANIKGAVAKNLIQLKSLEVRLALVPLFGGVVKVERVKLVDPIIELETLPDGQYNWIFKTGAFPSDKKLENISQPQIISSGKKQNLNIKSKLQSDVFVPIALDSFGIENGTVIYRNSIKGTVEKFESVSGEFSAASMNGPFDGSGKLIARGLPITFDLNFGEIIHGRTLAFAFRTGTDSGNLNIFLSGTLVGLGNSPRIKGSIKGEAVSLGAFMKAVNVKEFPKPLKESFNFDANITARVDGADVKDLELRFGKTKVRGDINIKFGKTPNVVARLETKHVNLDKWLNNEAIEPPSVSRGVSGAGNTNPVVLGKETARKLRKRKHFFIPTFLQASLKLTADAMTLRDRVIRNGLVNAELSNGEITLSQASAQFPGGSDMALFGFVTAKDGEPQFEGELESTVNDLRSVLDWLGHDLESVGKDRLRKLTLAARVFVSPDQLKMANIKLRFDSSKLSGGVTVALRKRPSFGANITVNKFNLDAYLPNQHKKIEKKNIVSGLGGAKERKKTSPEILKKNNPFATLNFLNDLDANFKIKIKSLMLNKKSIRNAIFDGTLYNGSLDIRRLSADQLINSKLSAKGKISNFGGIPKATAFSIAAETKDANGLLKYVGLSSVQALKGLGSIKAHGQIDGSILAPIVGLNFSGSGAQVKASGQIDGLALPPSMKDFAVQINAKETSKLLKIFGIKAISARQLGNVNVDCKINGNLLAPTLVVDVNAMGGSVSLNGKINTLTKDKLLDFSLGIKHPNAAQLFRKFGGYRPAGKVGSLDINGQLVGNLKAFTLKALTAKVDSTELRGGLDLYLDRVRPKFKASLISNKIVVDPFLPSNRKVSFWPGLQIRQVSTRKRFSNWSTDPIDLSGLDGVDAQVSLKSSAIGFKRYNLQKADILFSLEKGILRAERITGMIFGGALKAKASATTISRPHVEASLSLEDMDVALATSALKGAPISTGKMGLDFNLQSVGGSVETLIGSLGGEGAFQFRNLNVQNGRSKNILAGALGLVSALNQVSGILGVGKTNDNSVNFSSVFSIRKGIATSKNIRIISGLGEGKAEGVINLPLWGIDIKGNVKLGQNLLKVIASRGNRKKISQELPFAVYGNLDSPNIKLDTSKITGLALRLPGAEKLLNKLPKGVGGVLQGILGGKINRHETVPSENAQPSAPTQQPKNKIDPVDVLKEIFRRR
ncbi:MAG: AsmA family protein [Pseudomonadota bacterium]|nr:AsmA family protein [Pseudomonadota bacterium]